MTHDPLDDPMLDGLDRWHATAGTYSLDGTYIPDGTYVRLDDLPDLIARVREDERKYGMVPGFDLGYAACKRDAVEAVKALPVWKPMVDATVVDANEVMAAIEALSANADSNPNVHERRQAAAELTRMAQEDGLS